MRFINGQAITVVLACALPVSAESERTTFHKEPYPFTLRASDEMPTRTEQILREMVDVPAAALLRIHFGDHNLGADSYVTLTSLQDGGYQVLNAETLAQWSNSSAIFNGNRVTVELHAAPGESDVFVEIEEVTVVDPYGIGGNDRADGAPMDICGDHDNRVPSNDSRAGRLFYGGCTGWLISNGAALTAGHCGTPDGDLTGVVIEFDVPPSLPNGVPVAADPLDQYPVLAGTVSFEANGTGEDWSVYRLGPNSTTLLHAHDVQSAYRVTTVIPAEDDTMRVTGYGVDDMPNGTTAWHCLGGPNHGMACGNDGDCAGSPCVAPACCDIDDDDECDFTCNGAAFTQQTSTGRYDQISGSTHEYEVDTMPANSGSPIIWEANGYTVGIHTAGGCDNILAGYENHGTWFGYGPLLTAVQNASPANTFYVDRYAPSFFEFGGVFSPFHSVGLAVALVPSGATIAILAGDYPASAGNAFTAGADGRAVTLTSAFGYVTIGD